MGLSDECQNEAISFIVLRDLAKDIRDALGGLETPETRLKMLKVQLGHINKSGYLTDSEYNNLTNLVAAVESYMPHEPLPEIERLSDIEARMKKLEQPLSHAIHLKDEVEDMMFQKVVACQLKWR